LPDSNPDTGFTFLVPAYSVCPGNYYYYTRLTAFFQDNLGTRKVKPVWASAG